MSDAAPLPAAPNVAARKPARWLWIGFFVSVALNLFLVGWVAASWVGGIGPRPAGPGALGAGFNHFVARQALGDEHRRAADQIWRERFADMRQRAVAVREARNELARLLTADTADAAAIEAASRAVRARSDALIEHLAATLARIGATLPAEARKAYMQAGFNPRGRDGERRREGERPRRPVQ
jgi:uncharacterized membrane protein